MRTLTSALALTMALLSCACAALAGNSQTQIDGGQTFVLGGEQRTPVFVEGRNVGTVPIEVIKQAKGERMPLQTVAPGQAFSATFGAGEMAMLRNTSPTQRAVVKVSFNRDVSELSMRYIELK
jgi:hypothetical protein